MDVKWYSKYVYLVGAVLSFADPITDILTLAEFYREDHKTWFVVGLCFVFLPWVPFGYYYVVFERSLTIAIEQPERRRARSCNWLKSFLIGFHPFSVAVARVRMFVICLKDKDEAANAKNKKDYSEAAALFEAVLESAPQFVIQLYVISIQHESVSVIQWISLPISLLSLVWTFTSDEITSDIHVKHCCFLFVTNLFLVSSRLFAVSYFTVSYKWWIISVVMLHSISMMLAGYICHNGRPHILPFRSIRDAVDFICRKFCVQWLKDDFPFSSLSDTNTILWVANALFVVENLVMILLFYFNGHSNTWYALPVTICVCVFTVLGGIMRITHFYLLNEQEIVTQDIPVYPPLENEIIPSTNFQGFYETAV